MNRKNSSQFYAETAECMESGRVNGFNSKPMFSLFLPQADVTLSRDFRLRKSSMGDTPSSKYPPNSTRVDKLIADQMREHQKVIIL